MNVTILHCARKLGLASDSFDSGTHVVIIVIVLFYLFHFILHSWLIKWLGLAWLGLA